MQPIHLAQPFNLIADLPFASNKSPIINYAQQAADVSSEGLAYQAANQAQYADIISITDKLVAKEDKLDDAAIEAELREIIQALQLSEEILLTNSK